MRTTPVPLTGARGATPPPLNDQLGLLESQLQTALPRWHRARLNGLAKALLALIVASSANLTKVARACAGRAKVASHHRRLQRLLAGFVPFVSDGALARLLAAWSGVEPPWVLSLRSHRLAAAPSGWPASALGQLLGVRHRQGWSRLPAVVDVVAQKGRLLGGPAHPALRTLFGPLWASGRTLHRHGPGVWRQSVAGVVAGPRTQFPTALVRRAPPEQCARRTDPRTAALRPFSPGAG